MKETAAQRRRLEPRRQFVRGELVDDLLCYMDQASFVGLRALGRQPVVHFTWLYRNLLDEVAVQALNERLAKGLLGRVLQRSPLPWGRHRWVARPIPAPVTWLMRPIPAKGLIAARGWLADLQVDPENGPGWRLVVQLLEDGGCALSLLVSHTIADARAAAEAIADAVAGRPFHPVFPPACWRFSPVKIMRDTVECCRALPSVWQALRTLFKQSRSSGVSFSKEGRSSSVLLHPQPDPLILVPLVHLDLDVSSCEQRAAVLGVRLNTLLAAVVVRLAFRMGRFDRQGCVKLVLPVSVRHPQERCGNALRSVAVQVEPGACLADPRLLQRKINVALAAMRRQPDALSQLLPLTPYVPLRLARRMERMALGAEQPVGCSLVGDLPAELFHPCGQASGFQLSALERYRLSELKQLGGQLFVVCSRLGSHVSMSVCGYAEGAVTCPSELESLVNDALTDLALRADIATPA